MQALVGPGDEVIVFDPAYDSYSRRSQLAGARCMHVPLQPPQFRYDWERVDRGVQRAHAADDRQFAAQSRLHLHDGAGSDSSSPR